jgi:uncharacterized protein YndB with AHSA1/START domain
VVGRKRNCRVAGVADETARTIAQDPGDTGGRVTRSVEVDADPEAVWHAVVDPGERARWLDDPDAVSRHVRIDESTPGERLVWTWWHPGDEAGASTVTVELSPGVGGRTRVTVSEAVPGAVPGPAARARPGAALADGGVVGPAPSPAHRHCDHWVARLLGLELMFAAAHAVVA